MSGPAFNETSLSSSFDRLISKGTISYDYSQRIVPYTTPPFPALFIITQAFSQKPDFGEAAATTQELLPGSDISIKGYEITDVGSTHVLAFNRYSSYRPHLILLTKDGYQRQFQDLNSGDIQAIWTVISNIQSEQNWIGIFNCGENGGCSRLHKHLQVFPIPKQEGKSWVLFPDEKDDSKINVPFKYFLHRFDETKTTTHQSIFEMYVDLLRQARDVLKIGPEKPCPHNIVLNKRWMIVIPRRKAEVEGLGVNAASMMGVITLKNDEEYQKWLEIGVQNVLAETGVAA